MAKPIPWHLPHRDPRETLLQRIENAPKEHAEAVLAAFDILQGLHDKGLLELAKGALNSGEKILEILVEAGDKPEIIRGLRNFIILTKLFAALDPKILDHLAQAVPNALTKAQTEPPLGLVGLLGKAANSDSRRMMTLLLCVIESLGKDMATNPP